LREQVVAGDPPRFSASPLPDQLLDAESWPAQRVD